MTSTTTDISNSDDMIDVRDVIAQVEALREELGDAHDDSAENDILDMRAKLTELEDLLSGLAGNGGDEQWEGDWYPISLIRDSYFTEAMQEMVQDIGDLPHGMPAYLAIDWEATADNLRVDYSCVEFDGVTYWYR